MITTSAVFGLNPISGTDAARISEMATAGLVNVHSLYVETLLRRDYPNRLAVANMLARRKKELSNLFPIKVTMGKLKKLMLRSVKDNICAD